MFTGIVEEVGRVRSVGNGRIEIAAEKVTEGTAIGDSIAVNGVCLTVAAFTRGGFAADVMPVTLQHTALGTLRAGDQVNLERALTLTSRLGGHIVSGHIDGVGRVERVETDGNARILRVGASLKILRYIVPQGSVALDGTSLTVAEVDDNGFS
ncbi:MAG: riboflavin synthase, partial [Schwartzia sp.]|nr:riboflavin synthase [Schwartzia sp. (in: firmicutes)]